MQTVIKPFGQPEPDEVRAVRQLVATNGYAQSIVRVEYVDASGELIRYRNVGPDMAPRRAAAERFVLTDEGAAAHDLILTSMGVIG